MINLDVIKGYNAKEMADFIFELMSEKYCKICPAELTCDDLMSCNSPMTCEQKVEVWLNKSAEEME